MHSSSYRSPYTLGILPQFLTTDTNRHRANISQPSSLVLVRVQLEGALDLCARLTHARLGRALDLVAVPVDARLGRALDLSAPDPASVYVFIGKGDSRFASAAGLHVMSRKIATHSTPDHQYWGV